MMKKFLSCVLVVTLLLTLALAIPVNAKLTGISWFGAENRGGIPDGLWTRCYRSMLDQMWSLGFNCLRLPFSNAMIHDTRPAGANAINEALGYNYELDKLTPIQVYDKIVDYAYLKGFKIILDRHCTSGSVYPELWYDNNYSEQQWIDDWKFMVQRYGSKIYGCDISNEPHGSATWGSGVTSTDWRLAAERCGAAIQTVNPNVKIVVEGIENYNGNFNWWGGNLMGVKDYPVRLNNVIYSPHEYGPDTYNQPWFSEPTFPNNLAARWDIYWGYITKQNLGSLWVGEFGSSNTSLTTTQGKWFKTFLDYMETNNPNVEWAYWCFNTNSGEGHGILTSDWSTVDQGATTNKWDTLKPYIDGVTTSPKLYVDP